MDKVQHDRAKQGLLDAIAAAGSESKLARILQVTQGAVNQRRRSSERPYLTGEQAVVVEQRLGIPRATTRPDLFEGYALPLADDGFIPVHAGDALNISVGLVTGLQVEMVDFDRVVQRLPRPREMLSARGIYGLRTATTNMTPRFEPGSLILAESHVPPATGDDVLVHRDLGTPATQVTVALLSDQDADTVTLQQHATGASATMRRDELKAIHRTLTTEEVEAIVPARD